jgi:hypothetical protein
MMPRGGRLAPPSPKQMKKVHATPSIKSNAGPVQCRGTGITAGANVRQTRNTCQYHPLAP